MPRPRPLPAVIAELRARAIAAGIDYDNLSPLLRIDHITQPAESENRPPGLLPIADRTWYGWVAEGLVPEPIRFASGVSCWLRDDIIRIALDGLQREPGHGRKLAGRGAAAALGVKAALANEPATSQPHAQAPAPAELSKQQISKQERRRRPSRRNKTVTPSKRRRDVDVRRDLAIE
jgi:hypothetical protein